MRALEQLGLDADTIWSACGYDEAAFPDIAAKALQDAALHTHISPLDVIRFVHETPSLPPQEDIESRFGQPPITLFRTDRFYIAALFWVDGTTSIHQHGFSGAFQVLSGSSLHTGYRFQADTVITPRTVIGDLSVGRSELLVQGDVRPITAGDRFIHTLFHLDRPSVSLVMRTFLEPRYQPQYEYYKPGLAHDPFSKVPLIRRQVQALRLLHAVDSPEFYAASRTLVSGGDAETAYLVLDSVSELLKDSRRFDALLDCARDRHGSFIDLLIPIFEEKQRARSIIGKRRRITDPDHRFFLALLLNVDDRDRVLRLVASRHPDQDPVETIVKWVSEMTGIQLLIQIGGAQWEPNVLGIPQAGSVLAPVLRHLLHGGLRADLRLPPGTGANDAQVDELWRFFGSSSILRPLLS